MGLTKSANSVAERTWADNPDLDQLAGDEGGGAGKTDKKKSQKKKARAAVRGQHVISRVFVFVVCWLLTLDSPMRAPTYKS